MVKKTISKEREERLSKLKDKGSGKFFIVPMYQGLTLGPIEGLIDIGTTINKITDGGAPALVLYKGILKHIYRGKKRELAVIMHLSASTTLAPDQNHQVIIGTVKEALLLGATAVSVRVNLGADNEAKMMQDFAQISTVCSTFKVPLLSMMHACGPMIDDPTDVELVKHVSRVGAELGADVVITNYTGSVDTFKEVVKSCPVPIVVTDESKMNLDLEVLRFVKDIMNSGAAGVAIGRNIFQNKNISGITRAISKLFQDDADVEVVYKNLMEKKALV